MSSTDLAYPLPGTAPSASHADRARWLALIVLCMGFLMIILDSTIVTVALPSIQTDLHFSQSSLAWVVNSYLIAFGSLLLLAGRLGDLLGRKRIFLIGLALFTSASALCGLAQSGAMLVGARFVQGVGGALTSAVILGMIVTMFREPREQAKAIGVYSFVASAGASIGLLLGGVLTQAINWHWIFFVNVPIGVVTGLVAIRIIDADEGIGTQGGADAPGATLLVASLMLAVYTIVEVSSYGWGSLHTLGLGAVATALLAGFLARQKMAASPLMPLDIFRSPSVTIANAVGLLFVAGMYGMFFLGALYLQRVLGYSAIGVGLAFLPLALVLAGLSLGPSTGLVMRFGPSRTLLLGVVVTAAGLVLLQRLPANGASYATDVLPAMLLLGAGAGVSFPAMMTLAMTGATERDSGLASGLVNTSQQMGGAIGLAVLATLSATRTGSLRASGHPLASALTGGYHLAWGVSAGLLVLAFALAAPLALARRGARHGMEAVPAAETAADVDASVPAVVDAAAAYLEAA